MRTLWWLQSIPPRSPDNPSQQTLTFSKPLCLLLLYKLAGGGRTAERKRQRRMEWVAGTKSRRFRVRQWERQHKKERPCVWAQQERGGVVRADEWVAVSDNPVTNSDNEGWASLLKNQTSMARKLYSSNTWVVDRASGDMKCPLNPSFF